MSILVKRFDKNFPLPSRDEGAVCFDLVCRETVIIEPHKIGHVPLNIAVKVPNGFALLLFVRSSTPYKRGLVLANGVGVVDPYFCGDKDELLALFLNITDESVTVEAGEKLVQGMLVKSESVAWQELDTMPDTGHGGYHLEEA